MSKIIACYKVFNEADYLEYSLRSIYDYVDEIIIFEGCLHGMAKVVVPSRVIDGLSGDGTTEIITSFPDPDNKIRYFPLGNIEGDQTILYQKMVDYANIEDYIWLVDGDEIYSELLCEVLSEWMKRKTYHVMWIPNLVFWHDFKHIRLDHSTTNQRIFMKLTDKMFYNPMDVEVHYYDENGDAGGYLKPDYPRLNIFNGSELRRFLAEVPNFFYYHYAYVRSPQRILEKMLSQFYQNIITNPDEHGAELEHSYRYNSIAEFKIQTHSWFTNHDFENVGICTLAHPSVLNNEWSKHRWNEDRVAIDIEQVERLIKVHENNVDSYIGV